MEQYKGVRLGDLSPHVFAVADASYRWAHFLYIVVSFISKHVLLNNKALIILLVSSVGVFCKTVRQYISWCLK